MSLAALKTKEAKTIMVWSQNYQFLKNLRHSDHPGHLITHIEKIEELLNFFDTKYWGIVVDMDSISKEEINKLKSHTYIFNKCIFLSIGLSKNSSKISDEIPKNQTTKKSSFIAIEATKSLSQNMIELNNMVAKVSPIDVSIVLQGESGVGKEVFAKRIHMKGPRSNGPWVAVNCPAIPDNLMESELFGHEKGAFTGATSRKIGKFELANGGTLFLDEIADFSLECQAKILRVLQEREIEPLGSLKPIPVDIRLICASSKNLRELVEQDLFREDLFYRLADVELYIPPLRQRTIDIQLLIPFFAKQFSKESKCPSKTFTPAAVDYLKQQAWHGNVRELKSYVRRIMIISESHEIGIKEIEENSQLLHINKNPSNTPQISPEPSNKLVSEKDLIIASLTKMRFNVTKTAKDLGMGRATLYRKLKKYSIKAK